MDIETLEGKFSDEIQKYVDELRDELRVQTGKAMFAGASTYAAEETVKTASEIIHNMEQAKEVLEAQEKKTRRSYMAMMDNYLKLLHDHEKNKTHLPEQLIEEEKEEFITEDEMKL